MNRRRRRAAGKQGRPNRPAVATTRAVVPPGIAELFVEGVAHHQAARFAQAEACYRRILAAHPGNADALHLLGVIARQVGRYDIAVGLISQAIERDANNPDFFANLGNALRDQGKLDEAAAACRDAIRIAPNFAVAHCNLGTVLFAQGKYGEAVAAHRQAIRIDPDFVGAQSNIGAALSAQGRIPEAIAAYRHATRLRPDFASASSNLLLCLNYDERVSAAALFDAHRDWADRHGRMEPRPAAHANDRSAERRLKVGYVSPDFRSHSVAHFLEPLLRGHDRKVVEVFCYADVNVPDARTERFKQLADRWVGAVGMSDEALAERIRRDGIDILVDLAGHTANSRLPVFARKPAPVQVTWLGYPNTTGLKAIDYRLVDAVTDPEGQADAFASETLVRLPGGFLCYEGPAHAPEPADPPCLAGATVTFGSFNNVAKLSGMNLDAWAALLARLPAARLFLKAKAFADPATRASFLERLGNCGVAAHRVDFAAFVPEAEHLASYGRVDIALDPFPYNGTTTTCEASWMGVPVVTLRGDRHAGRVGASLLTQFGLTDLIAGSVDEYVEIAAALAGDPARLAELRHSLRPRMAASPLCDAPAFARKIEAAYRTMWRRWLQAPADEFADAGAVAKLGQASNEPAGTVTADLFRSGLAHHQAGRLAEAEGCYRQVLAAQPNHADALNMLGVLAHQMGRPETAVELIRRAIENNGNNPGYFCNLGYALRDQGRAEEAAAAARQAIRIKPDLAAAHFNLGCALHAQGQLDEAAAAYREAIRIDPNLAEAHSNLGNILRTRDSSTARSQPAVRRSVSTPAWPMPTAI